MAPNSPKLRAKASTAPVSLRRSTLELILPKVLKDSGTTIVPYFGDANARYLKTDDKGFYKVTAIMSMDGVQLVAPSDLSGDSDGKIDISYENRFAVLGAERAARLSDGWKYKSTVQLSYATQNLSFLNDRINFDLNQVRVPSEVIKKFDRNQYLYIGVEPNYTVFKADIVAPSPNQDDPFFDFEAAPRNIINRTFKSFGGASWIAYDQPIGDLIVSPGVRYFYSGFIKKSSIDPRISARYKIGDSTVKGAVGQYSIEPQGYESSEEFGNPDLDYEKSNHYILGVETKYSTSISRATFAMSGLEIGVRQLLNDYKGKVRWVVRDFPLGFHKRARPAAVAARCAKDQGKYWEMYEELFKNQRSLEDEDLKKYAKNIGLQLDKFQKCFENPTEQLKIIEKNFKSGEELGVTGTPAFFINGRRIAGALPYEEFKRIFDEELQNTVKK